MNLIKKYKNIISLISKRKLFGISNSEQIELRKWREESESNNALYKKLMEEKSVETYLKDREKIKINNLWKKVEEETFGKNSKRIYFNFFKYAASILIITSVSLIFYFTNKVEKTEKKITNQQIAPGKAKAKLILADGKIIDLETNNNIKKTIISNGIQITQDSNIVSYNFKNIAVKKLKYNTIITPIGGEYELLLSDDTKVFLNSNSTLKYPIHFIGKQRKVYLSGEGYFQVAKNKQKPFIVNTNQINIKVTGTEFNIKNYANDSYIETTLVEGSVDVLYNNKKTKSLIPSTQFVFNKKEKSGIVKTVNVNHYISWKDGYLTFKNNRLEDIMKILERWYNIKVFYMNESVKEIKFGGKLNKYENINPILDIISTTNSLKIDIKGNSIILREK